MFKLVSKEGDFLSILYRISEEGNEVLAYIDKERCEKMYDGILPKAGSALELDVQNDDIVIFDMVGAGPEAEVLKSKGYTVIGGGRFNDEIELDRAIGANFLQQGGIRTPETHQFSAFEEATAYVREKPARYVFKPHGNLETDLTYVSQSAEELLAVLPYLEKRCEEGTIFELQEFIDGIEMSTEAWFNGERFIQPLNSTMEEKKLFPGDVGPNTGCQGNVVWVWPEEESETLYNLLFKGLEEQLRDQKYLGPLDINAIWTPDGPYALEFTARFGYDAIQAFTRLWTKPIGETLANLGHLNEFPASPGAYAMTVRVTVPPYPHEVGEDAPSVPILGITEKMAGNVYLSDVHTEDGILKCAGADGYVLCVGDDGNDLASVSRRVYAITDKLQIPGKQYRIDIGSRVKGEKMAVGRILKKLLDR